MKAIPKITSRPVLPESDELGYIGCIVIDSPGTAGARSDAERRGGTIDGDRVIACGGAGRPLLIVSHDGGATFARKSTPVTSGLRSLALGDGALHVVGDHGTIGVSVDGGLTWARVHVDTQECLQRIQRTRDGALWVVGDAGHVFRSADGTDYARVATTARRVDGGDDDDDARVRGFVIEAGGEPRALTLAAEHPLCGLAVTARGTWLVCGDRAQLYRSSDGGDT